MGQLDLGYEEILNFYKKYIKLEQVIRKGWLMCKVPSTRLESVADHTLQLIMLSSILTKKLKIEVDYTRLVDMLLVHDLGETIIGDISEVESGNDNKHDKEKNAVISIFSELDSGSCSYYYSLWEEMEEQKTVLSNYAFQLDKIDAIIKAGIYEEEFSLEGLFDEFYNHQQDKGTFNNGFLKDFAEYLNKKQHDKM